MTIVIDYENVSEITLDGTKYKYGTAECALVFEPITTFTNSSDGTITIPWIRGTVGGYVGRFFTICSKNHANNGTRLPFVYELS